MKGRSGAGDGTVDMMFAEILQPNDIKATEPEGVVGGGGYVGVDIIENSRLKADLNICKVVIGLSSTRLSQPGLCTSVSQQCRQERLHSLHPRLIILRPFPLYCYELLTFTLTHYLK